MPKPIIAIIVATKTEFEAARYVLQECFRSCSSFGTHAFFCDLGHVFVLVQSLRNMGNLDAALGTSDVIRQYRPICVIGAGMCAGTEVKSVPKKFCDIITSTDVIYYEPSKKWRPVPEWRPRLFSSSIPAHLRRKITPPKQAVFNSHKPRGQGCPTPSVHEGLYASGESVLADASVVEKLRTRTVGEFGNDIAAIEMEGAGIALACEPTKTKFMMAKAIVDFGTKDKTGLWQDCASVISIGAVVEWAKSLTDEDLQVLHSRSAPSHDSDPYVRGLRLAALAGSMLPTNGVSFEQVKERKADDLITAYDIRNEKLLLCGLKQEGETFIGEDIPGLEEENIKSWQGKCWIVDPIDGTQNLVAARPEVGISVAYYNDLTPLAALIHLPYRELTVGITKNGQLEVNGIPWVRRQPPKEHLSDAVVALPGDLRKVKGTGVEGLIAKIVGRAAGIRITGALAYDLACIALGEFDARISTSSKLVDVAAGVTLIRQTGGIVSDISGNPWVPSSRTVVAASTPKLHSELIELLRQA